MEPEYLLHSLQEPANGSCPDPDYSSPQLPIVSPQDPF
jgi:hypothetical protein